MRRENVFFHDEIFVEDNLRGRVDEEELWVMVCRLFWSFENVYGGW